MEKMIAVLIDVETSPYLSSPLDRKGRNSFDIVLDKITRLDISYYVFSSTGRKGAIPFNGDLLSLLNSLEANLPPFEHLIFFHSEMPLQDIDLAKKIIDSHLENIADYSFGEHYPEGFSSFALQYGTFKKMQLLTQGNNEPYNYRSLDKLIQLDINSYDVEIVLAPHDLRIVRDSFRITNKRSFELVRLFLEHSGETQDLMQFFTRSSALLRPMPSYVNLELSSDCNQKCGFCPHTHRKNLKTHLTNQAFIHIMDNLKSFTESCTVELSGYGEPLLNPEIREILNSLGNYPDFQFILETNGILLGSYLDMFENIKNLLVVISIDAPQPELYQQIRGTAGFEKVEENIEKFFNRYPEKGYLQITRMQQNEEALDAFLQRWRVYRDRILIQKYNDFNQEFADEKVVDLSPLLRFACWKLQREMFIHADGDVSLCSQDFNKQQVLGNVLREKIEDLWEKSNLCYKAHWHGDYQGFCAKCDQWYIFNC